jgi:GntR family transcriptional repressor for pyruvate dehydrogenase complex
MGLTDEAISKIKEMIVAGQIAPGEKLPKEQDLAGLLGLSRNSLREAVKALSLVGVLESRQGDGTYVTNLEPETLLAGTSLVSDLVSGVSILELHQVRRLLEPAATADAASRLTEVDFARLEDSLVRMEAAQTTEEFIENDLEFHRVIVDACGNATLASLIKGLSGGTQRAHVWRAVREQGATQRTIRMHREILDGLRAGDAERARAADLLHLIDGELWLRRTRDEDEAG